ncbi:MAG: FecR domain-containing protein [Verrucomicrobia bacterium]|nr:FecR domain-containing protein [Verrucomicrobiota bacterium]
MKFVFLSLLFIIAASTQAKDALVKVTFGRTSAPAMTELKAGSRFSTSSKSRSEIALENGLMRTGSNTSVLMQSEDNIVLEKGLTLVATKPRFFRRSIQVQTPAHQLKIKGTAQIYHNPGQSIRVVVIEGIMTISLNSMSREKVTLRAGQVLLINLAETELPEPLEIDLGRLISSAELLADQFEPLPSNDLIQDASSRQARDYDILDSSDGDESGDEEDEWDDGDASEDDFDDSSDIDARNEELLHSAAADAIDDLDGDGDPDDGLFNP